jgi:hypothetical protein
MVSIARLAFGSAIRWAGHVRSGRLRRSSARIGATYRIDHGGQYQIFRETIGTDRSVDPLCVLVVGFRLKVIDRNRLWHWVFQRLCLLTTPFWSGFRGFRIKLWMVDPATKNYLGIYQWAGEANARNYVKTLCRVLRSVSTPGSVWHVIYPEADFEQYLQERLVTG